ncbi:MAG: transglycosylase SLT domain-containing protein [Thermodesulfobacteriota bacterium]
MLLSGCSSLSFIIQKNFPASSLSLPTENNPKLYQEGKEGVPPELGISKVDKVSVAEIDSPLDLSFEHALIDFSKDLSLKDIPLLPPEYELFSFADPLFTPEDLYLSEFQEAVPPKASLLAKPKKKDNIPSLREEGLAQEEIKPYYFSFSNLLEEIKPSFNSSEDLSNAENFILENLSSSANNPEVDKEVDKKKEEKASKEPSSNLVSLFPSVLHEKVKDFINYFQNKADSFFSKALARSQAYEEMMKKIFREKNLPEELFYLALIESGFNPFAVSRKQAGGIWQFVSKTAKRFGLRVDKWVDERRDPEKSTYAAAEYLKQLYEMFNCWELAAASYNAGEGKILKAIKKTQSQNFWEITQYKYLKPETKKYVPMFLAAMLIAKEPEKYGFSNIPHLPPLNYEKIIVPPATSLAWIAKVSETDLAELRALNPSLKLDKTPPQEEFEIKLPLGKKEVFERNIAARQKLASLGNQKHRVRYGETLSGIARRYRVNLNKLCELNGLSPKDKIKPGLTLILPP